MVSGLVAKQNNNALLQSRAGIPRFPSIRFHFGEFSSRNFKQEHFKGKQRRHKGTGNKSKLLDQYECTYTERMSMLHSGWAFKISWYQENPKPSNPLFRARGKFSTKNP